MKKALIITLGTRDVQIDPQAAQDAGRIIESTAPDGKKLLHFRAAAGEQGLIEVFRDKDVHTFIPASPRFAGEALQQHFDECQPYLLFPMVEKLLHTLNLQASDTWDVLMVVTDQPTGKHSNRDTCNMAPLVQQWMSIKYPDAAWDFDTYTITEEVVNLDHQYRLFEQEASKLLEDSEAYDEVVFFPQGGIDQINQALTLRLIEVFRDKLNLYQVQEGHEQAVRREFVNLFLKNIYRHQLIMLVKEYDFHTVLKESAYNSSALLSPELINLSKLAVVLHSNNEEIIGEYLQPAILDYYKYKFPSIYGKLLEHYLPFSNAARNKLQYLISRLKYESGQLDDAVWRLYALGEIILKPIVEEYLGGKIQNEPIPFIEFNRLLRRKQGLVEKLKTQKQIAPKNGRHFRPSYGVFSAIYISAMNENPELAKGHLQRIRARIKDVKDARDSLVHTGLGISIESINEALSEQNFTLKELYQLIAAFLGMSKDGLDIYDLIKDEMLQQLDSNA